MSRFNRIKGIGFLLVLPVLLSVPAAADPPEESWAVIKIAGVPVGYVFEISERTPDGRVLVTSDSKIILNRLGNKVELATRSKSEETAAGRLLRSETELRASVMSTRTTTIVKPGSLEIESEAGGKTYSRTIPYEGELLGPEGIRRLSLDKLRAVGDAIEYLTLSPESGGLTKGRRTVLAREKIDVEGKSVSTMKVEEILDTTGIAGVSWLDSGGESVKSEMPTPFGLSEMIKTNRASALAAAGGGELPAEMYERSILKTNVRLPRARALDTVRVRLTLREGGPGWPDLNRPGQNVVSQTDTETVLDLQRVPAPRKAGRTASETKAEAEYLRPNEYIQSDLPEIQRIARSVAGGETDAFAAALKLERWVAENMTFDLGIAMAPASELIKNRRGTCVGYATLLATLTRASGIPSRVVLGYVYALGMFGGHAWTEIMVGEDWVPLDAAVVSAGAADPARVSFAASSLESGPLSLTGGPAARLFGGVDIRILAFGLDGSITEVMETGPPWTIDGDAYINPGLGLAWRKPAGFSFSSTDRVWPDATVAALDGPDGARVIFQEMTRPPWKEFSAAAEEAFSGHKVSGRARAIKLGACSGLRKDGSEEAVAVCDNAPDVWIFIARGKNASALLSEALEGFRSAGR
ncbi:MAG: transglutaminase domain-containing protein [Candidatus Aminicenantes bacterium]|nr:transglutaminase domain-containing protein [Candidatus Aminicenantes bacterium]